MLCRNLGSITSKSEPCLMRAPKVERQYRNLYATCRLLSPSFLNVIPESATRKNHRQQLRSAIRILNTLNL